MGIRSHPLRTVTRFQINTCPYGTCCSSGRVGSHPRRPRRSSRMGAARIPVGMSGKPILAGGLIAGRYRVTPFGSKKVGPARRRSVRLSLVHKPIVPFTRSLKDNFTVSIIHVALPITLTTNPPRLITHDPLCTLSARVPRRHASRLRGSVVW